MNAQDEKKGFAYRHWIRIDFLSNKAILLAWSVLLWAALVWLYTWNADFPFWYHWDEEGKSAQVISGDRDLCHPQLLLNTASLLEKFARPGSGNIQHVTILGRISSAAFSATAVVLLSICAFKAAGAWGAALAALLLGLHPRVLRLSHYFKEDSALLFGWVAVLFAAWFFLENRNPVRALILGVACGLAVSGKYVGLIVAICGLLFVLLHSPRHAVIALAAMVLTFALINIQSLFEPGVALERIRWEMHHQMHNVTGVSPPWVLAWEDVGLAGALLFAASILYSLRPTPFRPVVLLALGAQLIYSLVLCRISRMVPRYMLMIDVTTWWVIGLGLARFLQNKRLRDKPALFVLGCLVVLCVSGWRIQTFRSTWDRMSGQDSRIRMARQLDGLAMPGDVLMMDFRVLFPGAYAPQRDLNGWTPQLLMRPVKHWSGEMGEDMFDTLLKQGITLVAIAPVYVRHYLHLPEELEFGQFGDIRWRRPFYERLFSEGSLLLEEPGIPQSLRSPHLQLYRIADPDAPTVAP